MISSISCIFLFELVLNKILYDSIFALEANGSCEDSETFMSYKGPTEVSPGKTMAGVVFGSKDNYFFLLC